MEICNGPGIACTVVALVVVCWKFLCERNNIPRHTIVQDIAIDCVLFTINMNDMV